MPLLITPTQPLRTPGGLEVPSVYALVDEFTYSRKLRQASFTLGYYVHEPASLPGSGLSALRLSLPTGFTFQLAPTQVGALGDPTEVLEAYVTAELTRLLGEGATIENVA